MQADKGTYSRVAVLQYRLYIDPVQSADLEKVEQIDCGWTAPLPRMSHYDSATGLHQSLSACKAQYWVKQDGTTAKAASLAVPPLLQSSSVQRLTQHFETRLCGMLAALWNMGHCWTILLENPRRSSLTMAQSAGSLILLKYFQPLSWSRVRETSCNRTSIACSWISVQMDSQARSCLLCSTDGKTQEEAVLFTVLLG